MRSRTYEITFRGQAGGATRAEFDDCQVTVGSETTTLRCELPDQAALAGLIQRIIGLRLEITRMMLVEPATAPLPIPAQIANPAQIVAHSDGITTSEGIATQVT